MFWRRVHFRLRRRLNFFLSLEHWSVACTLVSLACPVSLTCLEPIMEQMNRHCLIWDLLSIWDSSFIKDWVHQGCRVVPMELIGTGNLGKRVSALSKGHRTVSGRFHHYYWRLLRQTCFVPECNWSRSFPLDRMTCRWHPCLPLAVQRVCQSVWNGWGDSDVGHGVAGTCAQCAAARHPDLHENLSSSTLRKAVMTSSQENPSSCQ